MTKKISWDIPKEKYVKKTSVIKQCDTLSDEPAHTLKYDFNIDSTVNKRASEEIQNDVINEEIYVHNYSETVESNVEAVPYVILAGKSRADTQQYIAWYKDSKEWHVSTIGTADTYENVLKVKRRVEHDFIILKENNRWAKCKTLDLEIVKVTPEMSVVSLYS